MEIEIDREKNRQTDREKERNEEKKIYQSFSLKSKSSNLNQNMYL